MSRNQRRRMQIGCVGRRGFAHRLLHPRGAHQHPGLPLQRPGKIYDAGAGLLRGLPMLPGKLRGAGEKREIDTLKGVGSDGLDKGDLVAHRFELPQSLLIVHQQELRGGKAGFGERLVELFAPNGSGSDNRNTVAVGHRLSCPKWLMDAPMDGMEGARGGRLVLPPRVSPVDGGGAARNKQPGRRCRKTYNRRRAPGARTGKR